MILPLFGFANAGVALSGMTMNDCCRGSGRRGAGPVLVNRQVFYLSLLAGQPGPGETPEKSTWLQVYGVSVLWIGLYHEPIGNLALQAASAR
jgi:NhaA family Na+:H+ antiporter